MDAYLPYIVSVLCAVISGFTSYIIARKQTKADLEKMEKQYSLDIESEREKFSMEMEKKEIEHKYQLELMQKEYENKISSELTNTFISEAFKLPEVRKQLSSGIMSSNKNKKK